MRAKLKPQFVFFDSGFANQKLLKRIDDYGWAFISRITKTRKFNDIAMWRYKKQGFWNDVGLLSNGLKIRAIRRADKFFVTNRVMIDASEVVKLYGKRHVIEEVFRVLKQECHWDRCQLRCAEAYERFLSLGCVSFVKWESLRLSQPSFSTIYNLRRSVIFDQTMLDFSLPDSISVEAFL
ncbi:MAG: transposase [Candidatus Sericytochromatia bacterium]|nr:transposase [Candidatus Sericytochromatia bacterium]